MNILDKEVLIRKIDSQQSVTFIGKGIIYTLDGKLETDEVVGITEDDVREKAENALMTLLAKTTGRKAD